jgi:ATP-dependent Clp protease ATP-binding subunit ClpA
MRANQDIPIDRFSDRASLALFQARAAVSEHGGQAITDAHLLLGLFKAAPELGPLLRPAINFQQLSECLVGAVAAQSLPADNAEVPYDASAQTVLRAAARIADGLARKNVTPADILLALVQGDMTASGRCLRSAGLDVGATTAAIVASR